MTDLKLYLSADQLLEDSFRLANLIFDSGFRPSHIVGLWRGGAPVGIAIQELFEYRGIETDHISIRTSSYSGIDQTEPEVRVYGLSYLIDTLNPDDALLVVDDVFDSGRSIRAFLHELRARCRNNMPATVKVATVYYKPARNVTDLKPDYYVHETGQWLIFPHEINGLSEAEIRTHKRGAALILRDAPEGAPDARFKLG
ncbi:MAG: hypoxanthine phosphoribosyltransferase [Sphingomonas sp. SCN 67-18]|uniref:phosphoribosyltransferase n=1 Tax=uncultured Sphingomonas sp. TaxID=158754 RepID=UPI00086E1921|nr:phosphoribosyltransferase family protein [Sphingomonas sp. SCN 67-18]ODU22854.1 MAG: hypoxanthine phosphoribosyltransferase [Sphingomonas sp. SCN 67-18]